MAEANPDLVISWSGRVQNACFQPSLPQQTKRDQDLIVQHCPRE